MLLDQFGEVDCFFPGRELFVEEGGWAVFGSPEGSEAAWCSVPCPSFLSSSKLVSCGITILKYTVMSILQLGEEPGTAPSFEYNFTWRAQVPSSFAGKHLEE